MKQRLHAHIEQIEVDGRPLELKEVPKAELEFSAIDTGGGFHDPIFDFAFTIAPADRQWSPDKERTIRLRLCDPSDSENKLEILYDGQLQKIAGGKVEGTGRLKDEAVSRKMIGFVMRCLR